MNPLKILVLFPKSIWMTKMSPARRHAVWALSDREDVDLGLCGQGWETWNNNLTAQENIDRNMPDCDVVLWYKPLGHKDAPPLREPENVKQLTVETYNEAWWPDGKAAKDVIQTKTKLVICHHANDVHQFDTVGKSHEFVVAHLPHCATKQIFAKAALPWDQRNIDFLLTGTISPEFYPLRERWAGLIRDNARRRPKEKLPGNVQVHRHPGYELNGIEQCEEAVAKYAAILGRSKIVLGCSSKYKYHLARFPEAAMAGCLHLSDLPKQFPAFATSWFLEVPAADWRTGTLILRAKLAYELGQRRGKEKSLEIQASAMQFASMECYADRFVTTVRSLL
jgi:hypothetical protein